MSGLELAGLHITVPDGEHTRILLDGVDLSVAAGDVVVLTGSSGSGKSSLLAVAGLLRRPAAGDVVVGGNSTEHLSERRRTLLRKQHIGIVYQSANLIPSLTAREQLELVAHVNGVKRRVARDRAAQLLTSVGLVHLLDALPGQLSGGERQRVGIARALMSEPSVLLADEPTASLDPDLAADIAGLIADEAHRRELATIIVTHDDAPGRHADRTLHLAAGALTERPPVAS
jgi:putative ABC transport system ATP-binding protein